VITVKATTRL